MFDFIKDLLTPEKLEGLIRYGGIILLVIIVFAETGLLVGFFLPGDSLLITAGLVSAQGYMDIFWLNIAVIAAAIAGDTVGYWFGKKSGKRLFRKEDSFFFSKQHVFRAKNFYEKYGGKAIIYARFVPFARTFAPIVAGIGEMDYVKFITYNVSGAVLWVTSMSLLGYYFGNIPFVKTHFEKVIIGVIILSVVPVIIGVLKEKRKKGVADDNRT